MRQSGLQIAFRKTVIQVSSDLLFIERLALSSLLRHR